MDRQNPVDPTSMFGDQAHNEAADPLVVSHKDLDLHAAVNNLHAQLEQITGEAKWDEMYGVILNTLHPTHMPTRIILSKYLISTRLNLVKAAAVLKRSLIWRRVTNARKSILRDHPAIFEGFGYVTTHVRVDNDRPYVVSWNIWSAVTPEILEVMKNEVDAFVAWRVTLMELSIEQLQLPTATEPVTEHHDPYRIAQVHDFTGFGVGPVVQRWNLLKENLGIFADMYPEFSGDKVIVTGGSFWLNTLLNLVRAFMPDMMRHTIVTKRRQAVGQQYLPVVHEEKGYPRQYCVGERERRVSAIMADAFRSHPGLFEESLRPLVADDDKNRKAFDNKIGVEGNARLVANVSSTGMKRLGYPARRPSDPPDMSKYTDAHLLHWNEYEPVDGSNGGRAVRADTDRHVDTATQTDLSWYGPQGSASNQH